MSRYYNVKVTCELASSMAGHKAPYLDSLCELVMASKMEAVQESRNGHRHAYAIAERGQPIDVSGVGKIPIPIARKVVNGLPVPKCSSPIYETPHDSVCYYTSAFPLDKADRLTAKEQTKIAQTGGRFKSFRLPLRKQLAPRVVWFAVLRERPTRLRKLLKPVTNLGKKTSQGHGVVANWTVERIDEDYAWYADSDLGTVLMRPLPLEMDHPPNLTGYRESFGGCCGPYWQHDFWTEIVEPC